MDNIEKLIRERRSVRTFDDKKLSAEDKEKLCDYIKTINNPYNLPVEFKLIENMSTPVVVGTDLYVAAKMKDTPDMSVAYGYSFEKMVLFALSLGIGTVWIGGTMDRASFEKAINLSDDEVMPCISPLGYIAKKMSLRETMMRKGVKANERLPLEEIAYKNSFENPLTKKDLDKLTLPLEMVRFAPSAVNKQPWRMVVTDDAVHFYLKRSKGFKATSKLDMQKIDIGIALCHFELTANEIGISTEFVVENPNIECKNSEEYIATYKYKI